ncbi:MAG: hypothetical protein PUP46_10715 [Endozoicomonas sp. (ex Botrylloides leachii)]|nr:hypothetical protein [Endozoicomonas sp. (ex Botrylloides leachii)]
MLIKRAHLFRQLIFLFLFLAINFISLNVYSHPDDEKPNQKNMLEMANQIEQVYQAGLINDNEMDSLIYFLSLPLAELKEKMESLIEGKQHWKNRIRIASFMLANYLGYRKYILYFVLLKFSGAICNNFIDPFNLLGFKPSNDIDDWFELSDYIIDNGEADTLQKAELKQ